MGDTSRDDDRLRDADDGDAEQQAVEDTSEAEQFKTWYCPLIDKLISLQLYTYDDII